MIKFDCDYLEGTHPKILDALVKTNMEQTVGYGEDEYCQKARQLIKDACNAPDADVHLLVGGTQTNALVISSALRPYQGVVCVESGHINVHEAGAIEATGHKVLALPTTDGKMTAENLDNYCCEYWADVTKEHIVQPAMLYISQPTESGMLYTKAELLELRKVCDKYSLIFFVDGARLIYSLANKNTDVRLPDLAKICDVFYIGGTKAGLLFGEAVVILNDAIKKDFRNMMKRAGAMLSKGRLLGVQFSELFTNGLYLEISSHAMECAQEIHAIFDDAGFEFLYNSPTNQLFPIIEDSLQEKLSEEFSFEFWKRVDEKCSAVRFCSSWATKKENIDKLRSAVEKYTQK